MATCLRVIYLGFYGRLHGCGFDKPDRPIVAQEDKFVPGRSANRNTRWADQNCLVYMGN